MAKNNPSHAAGIRYMLLSTFSFAVLNVFIKKAGDIPPMEVVFFRSGISLLICAAFIYRSKADWKGSNRSLLIARGTFGALSLYTFIVTLHNMPLGTAVTIQYLSPIFTTIIAIFLLKEKIKLLQWLFFIVSFIGVLVIKGVDSRISLFMLGIGIISAVASGFAYNIVRSLKEKETTMVVVLHFQIVGTLVGLFFSMFNWRTPVGMQWFYLVMTGICAQSVQVCLTKALQRVSIANATILNYLGILYAVIFGLLLFGERYDWITLLGMILVLAGVCMNFLYQKMTDNLVVEEELTAIEE